MQYVWGEGSLSGNNIYSCKALRGTEEKSFEAENTRLFYKIHMWLEPQYVGGSGSEENPL